MEVLAFEEELFSGGEVVECVAGDDLGLVDMTGYPVGRPLNVGQSHTHGEGRRAVCCVYSLTSQCWSVSTKNRIFLSELSRLMSYLLFSIINTKYFKSI